MKPKPISSLGIEDAFDWHLEVAHGANVAEFGAVGDGVADDTVAIQAAIDACVAAGGGTVYLPTGTYKTSAALHHTGSDVRIILAGAGADATMITGGGAVMLDLCGTSSCVIRDLRLHSTTADVGLLLARVNGRHSASHRLDNVTIAGTFEKACVYAICAELNLYSNVVLVNSATDPDSFCLFTSTDNDLAVTTSAGTIDDSADGATNTTGWYIGGKMWHDGTGVALGIRGDTGQWLFETYIASNFRGVVIDKSAHQDALNSGITFRDCLFEGEEATGLYFNDITINWLTIDRCKFYSTGTPESGFMVYQADVSKNLIGLRIDECMMNPTGVSVYILLRSAVSCNYGIEVRNAGISNVFTDGRPVFSGSASSYYGNVFLNNPGLGMPGYSASQRAALTPHAGLTIYNTDTNQINVYNGSAWRKVTDAAE